jgi:fibrillarin-like rRNA methylase
MLFYLSINQYKLGKQIISGAGKNAGKTNSYILFLGMQTGTCIVENLGMYMA